MPIKIDGNACIGCGVCEFVCPNDVIRMDWEARLANAIYNKDCVSCRRCEQHCVSSAIELITLRFVQKSIEGFVMKNYFAGLGIKAD